MCRTDVASLGNVWRLTKRVARDDKQTQLHSIGQDLPGRPQRAQVGGCFWLARCLLACALVLKSGRLVLKKVHSFVRKTGTKAQKHLSAPRAFLGGCGAVDVVVVAAAAACCCSSAAAMPLGNGADAAATFKLERNSRTGNQNSAAALAQGAGCRKSSGHSSNGRDHQAGGG